MDLADIEIRRSARRTLALEVRDDGQVIVRAPLKMPQATIEHFLQEKATWIARTQGRVALRQFDAGDAPTEAEIASWKWAARHDLALRLNYWAPRIGVDPGKLSIRCQHSRWGSCASGTRTISLNCQLMRVSEELRDYVVVHELCHLLQPNHSPAFWALVGRQLPDYRTRRKALRDIHLW
ncbi:MAG: M48 family metallopeptidase [Coriobacteriia bacterium]|nr:M48 family metallopeptidase [Coriobacteriia bacterium]